MAYKIVKEWKQGSEHEITVYKYNYNKDEMVRYYKSDYVDAVEIRTFYVFQNCDPKMDYYYPKVEAI